MLAAGHRRATATLAIALGGLCVIRSAVENSVQADEKLFAGQALAAPSPSAQITARSMLAETAFASSIDAGSVRGRLAHPMILLLTG